MDADHTVETSDTPDGFAVTLRGGDDVVLTIRAVTRAPSGPGAAADASWARALATGGARFSTAMRDTPASRSIDELRRGVEITGEYPAAPSGPWSRASAISPAQQRVLALCSYITGMELPGLRSLFTRVNVEFNRVDVVDGPLWYRARTRRCDAQFRAARNRVTGRHARRCAGRYGDTAELRPLQPDRHRPRRVGVTTDSRPPRVFVARSRW